MGCAWTAASLSLLLTSLCDQDVWSSHRDVAAGSCGYRGGLENVMSSKPSPKGKCRKHDCGKATLA